MIASLILLNWLSALRTLFGISHDPCYILTFCWVLKFPIASGCTIAWPVRFKAASEAKWVPTFAWNICYTIVLILNTIITPWVWAPPNILVIISVRFAKPFHVSLQVISFQELQELRMWYNNVALMLRAHTIYWLESFINFLAQIVLPVLFAELMAAY